MITLPRPSLRLRPAAILAAALVVVAGSYAIRSMPPQTSPVSPAAPAGPAAQAPLGGDAVTGDLERIADGIEVWTAKAAADPHDYISATNLGILYLGRARLTGDAADYERAVAAAERAVTADPSYTPGRTLRAILLHATHDFAGALAAAETLLAEDAANVDALAVAADAKVELGRLKEAGADYARLASLAPGPALDLRLARFAYLGGDGARALALAQRARDAALADGLADPAVYHGQVGEIARLVGASARARSSFEAALDARPSDQLALIGLSRVVASDGNDLVAIELLRRAADIAPRPETMALLGDLLRATGDTRGAEEAYATVRLTAELGGTSATLFDRQLLLFELDHGGASAELLATARAAAQARPDAAGLDLVAWAAYRLGDLETASEFSARGIASGTIDARILFHAGAIELASGDEEAGRAHLRAALDLGPALDPAERSEATGLLR